MTNYSVCMNNVYFATFASFENAFRAIHSMMTDAGFALRGALCDPDGETLYHYFKDGETVTFSIKPHEWEPDW